MAVVVLGVALAGCGEDTGATGTEKVDITPRAVAAIALEHVTPEPTRMSAADDDDEGFLGADLRFHGDGEYDGDLLVVRLGTGRADDVAEDDGTCAGEEDCTVLDTDVAGATLRLVWEEYHPEEDPGGFGVVLTRGRSAVTAYYAGEEITGDPREQDLEISVEDLVALVEDPALRLRTTSDAVAAGEELEGWSDAG